MYLLPISTFRDYLCAGPKWTARTGGTALLSLLLTSCAAQTSKEPVKGQSQVVVHSEGLTKLVETNQADPYAVMRKGGIRLGPNDIIGTQGKSIEIIRVEERLVVEDTPIPYLVENRHDDSLEPGTSRVVQEGVNGLQRNIIKITLIGGKQVGKEIVNSVAVSQPVKKIVATNPQLRVVSRGEGDRVSSGVKGELVMEATAYTFTGNNTAIGLRPRVGLIAVDPRVIPLGTKVYVEGYGQAVAADTGGAINGKRIDLFFNTLQDCKRWGRRRVKVYILGP